MKRKVLGCDFLLESRGNFVVIGHKKAGVGGLKGSFKGNGGQGFVENIFFKIDEKFYEGQIFLVKCVQRNNFLKFETSNHFNER